MIAAAALSVTFGAGAADKTTNDKKDVKPDAGFVMAFYAEPFDFEGIRLGMTVSEFKAAPLPVPKG